MVPNNVGYDQETGQSPKPVAFWTVGVNGAEVEVNTDTGEIRVLKMISCFDPGKVINPALYDAQVEGAMVQALGTALFEELMLKDGRILNRNFVDYKIPTADDMPELTVRVAEHEEPTGRTERAASASRSWYRARRRSPTRWPTRSGAGSSGCRSGPTTCSRRSRRRKPSRLKENKDRAAAAMRPGRRRCVFGQHGGIKGPGPEIHREMETRLILC